MVFIAAAAAEREMHLMDLSIYAKLFAYDIFHEII